jgi:hypothetical protein
VQSATRREFLGNLGHGMLIASLGATLAEQLGAMLPAAGCPSLTPLPDDLEALIRRMQDMAPEELLPQLVDACKGGTKLETLVTAGALANARTFGGSDYEGYHAFMALLPAYAMAQQMPKGLEALPLLKVLYRNTARIRAAGHGRLALEAVEAAETGEGGGAVELRQRVRDCDLAGAERRFARACGENLAQAGEDLQLLVRDELNVHRIVLAWRAHDMLRVAGKEHALELLRQVVRFCIDEEKNRVQRKRPVPAVREDVPRILDEHKLLENPLGDRQPDDARIEELAGLVFGGSRPDAAGAVAAALAEGIAPEAVGEAISLGANRLLLHDTGARRVHGASVGVHASDAANAWRNVAREGTPQTRAASLVVAAYHTAGQSQDVGREPYSYAEELAKLQTKDGAEILSAASKAIEQRDQRGAMAALRRYGDLGLPDEPAFQLLLRYAVSEDGALHAEKYFHTVREEYGRTRPSMRWQRVVAWARVTASEFGESAPGVAKARQLLQA